MLQHFHAGDDIERTGHFLAQRLGRHAPIGHVRCLRLQRVQLGDLERFFCQVYAQHVGTAASHGIRQNAAAAAHVQNTLPVQWASTVDPVESQWIDLMQRGKLALKVPPLVCQGGKLRQFSLICVHFGHASLSHGTPIRRGACSACVRGFTLLGHASAQTPCVGPKPVLG